MWKKLAVRPAQPIVIGVTLVALAVTVVFWLFMRRDEAAMQASGGYGIVDYAGEGPVHPDDLGNGGPGGSPTQPVG